MQAFLGDYKSNNSNAYEQSRKAEMLRDLKRAIGPNSTVHNIIQKSKQYKYEDKSL